MKIRQATLGICLLTAAFALAACGANPQSTDSSAAAPQSTVSSVSEPQSAPSQSTPADDYLNCTFTFDIPEGFVEVDGSSAGVNELYQADDGSSINVVVVENDGSLASDVTQDMIVPALEEAFTQQIGSSVTLENITFSNDEIDGCPSYQLSYTLNLNGITMSQTIIGLNGDKIYTFTFTDMTSSWGDVFQTAIDSIAAVPA